MFLLNNYTVLDNNEMPLTFTAMNEVYDELSSVLPKEWFVENYDELIEIFKEYEINYNFINYIKKEVVKSKELSITVF